MPRLLYVGRCGPAAAHHYACCAQRALLPIAVGVMNINELMNINVVRESATIFPCPCKLTFDLESGVRVTCDVGYLCANFGFPRPLCSRVIPGVHDRQRDVRRQTDVRQTDVKQPHRLMPPSRGRSIIILNILMAERLTLSKVVRDQRSEDQITTK